MGQPISVDVIFIFLPEGIWNSLNPWGLMHTHTLLVFCVVSIRSRGWTRAPTLPGNQIREIWFRFFLWPRTLAISAEWLVIIWGRAYLFVVHLLHEYWWKVKRKQKGEKTIKAENDKNVFVKCQWRRRIWIKVIKHDCMYKKNIVVGQSYETRRAFIIYSSRVLCLSYSCLIPVCRCCGTLSYCLCFSNQTDQGKDGGFGGGGIIEEEIGKGQIREGGCG